MSFKTDRPAKTGRGGAATVLDVGRLAGVSGKTVSRVINGDGAIRPSTRDRVRAAMEALDFHPNQAARSLRSARSFNIGLLTAHFSSFYFAEVVRGAARACAGHDYHLLIKEAPPEREARRLDSVLSQLKVDGFVLLPPLTDDAALLEALDRLGKPFVRISPAANTDRWPSVTADDASGVKALARHLWSLGHRRFGYVGGPASHGATHVRRQSFAAALLEAGVRPRDILDYQMPEALVLESQRHRTARAAAETGAQAVDRFMASPNPPTALFAFSDEIASGAVARAHQFGLSIPRDIAIAGFDDSDIGRILHPPLTTIRQPIIEMMEDAIRRLIERTGAGVSQSHAVELLVRASTDPGIVDELAPHIHPGAERLGGETDDEEQI